MEQTTIAYLERRYAALEKEIENALLHGPTDHLAIAYIPQGDCCRRDQTQSSSGGTYPQDAKLSERDRSGSAWQSARASAGFRPRKIHVLIVAGRHDRGRLIGLRMTQLAVTS